MRIFPRFRLVPDHRVKAFTRKRAEKFLKRSGNLFKPLTEERWAKLQEEPDEDIVTAYGDCCFEEDFSQKT